MKRELVTALYCRTARQSEQGIENQETMLRRYAENNNHGNVVVYADNGYSGVSLDRPGLRQLKADVNAGLVGIVLVKDVNRISRNFIQLAQLLNKLKKKSVTVKSVLDGFDFEERVSEMKAMRKALNKFYSMSRKRKKAV